MKLARISQGTGLHLIFLAAFLGATLWFPAAREMHVLTFRLLLNLRGDTLVQGQPPGCLIYVIPNVQFTPKHGEELRKRAANSLDDYVVALSMGGYSSFELPARPIPPDHPLLPWAAFWFAWRVEQQADFSSTSNHAGSNLQASEGIAREAVRLARSRDKTNGAFWLAEAVLDFSARDDRAALLALAMAATNGEWRGCMETSFTNMIAVFEKAELSRLDAVVSANNCAANIPLLAVQSRLMTGLRALMLTAVTNEDDRAFSELIGLLVQLRKAEWTDWDPTLRNAFRRFSLTDEVINAMALRLKREPLPKTGDLRVQGSLREQIFRDFLTQHADLETAALFRGQASVVKNEARLRSRINEIQSRSILWSGLWVSVFGMATLILASLCVTVLLCGLPFLWLIKTGGSPGQWPKGLQFWISTAALLALSLCLFYHLTLNLGIGVETGLRIPDPVEDRPSHPMAERLSLSILLCAVSFLALLITWKGHKAELKWWTPLPVSVNVYCVLVLLTAFFRTRLADQIAAGLLG